MNIIFEKAPIVYTFGAWISAVLAAVGMDTRIIMIISIAAAIDWAFAILAAFKTKTFSSHQGIIGAIAKLLGMILLLTVAYMFKVIGINSAIFTSIFALLAINDLLSALRHWYTIKTGERLAEYDAITALIKSLHDWLKHLTETFLSKLKGR